MPNSTLCLGAWLVALLCFAQSGWAKTPSLTLAESKVLSDPDLLEKVFDLVKASPVVASSRLPKHEQVISIVRPTGEGRSSPPLFRSVVRGFHDVTLHLRGRETVVESLCAFDEVDITFRPILPPGLEPGSKGWRKEISGMTEADFISLGMKVPEGFKPEYVVPNDPAVEVNSVRWSTDFVPAKRGQDCEKLERSTAQNIRASGPEIVHLALTLLPKAKRLPDGQKLLCVEDYHPHSRKQCLTLFKMAEAGDIRSAAHCLTDDGPNDRCVSIYSRDFSSDMMIRRTWVAHIIYSGGDHPRALNLRFETAGGVL